MSVYGCCIIHRCPRVTGYGYGKGKGYLRVRRKVIQIPGQSLTLCRAALYSIGLCGRCFPAIDLHGRGPLVIGLPFGQCICNDCVRILSIGIGEGNLIGKYRSFPNCSRIAGFLFLRYRVGNHIRLVPRSADGNIRLVCNQIIIIIYRIFRHANSEGYGTGSSRLLIFKCPGDPTAAFSAFITDTSRNQFRSGRYRIRNYNICLRRRSIRIHRIVDPVNGVGQNIAHAHQLAVDFGSRIFIVYRFGFFRIKIGVQERGIIVLHGSSQLAIAGIGYVYCNLLRGTVIGPAYWNCLRPNFCHIKDIFAGFRKGQITKTYSAALSILQTVLYNNSCSIRNASRCISRIQLDCIRISFCQRQLEGKGFHRISARHFLRYLQSRAAAQGHRCRLIGVGKCRSRSHCLIKSSCSFTVIIRNRGTQSSVPVICYGYRHGRHMAVIGDSVAGRILRHFFRYCVFKCFRGCALQILAGICDIPEHACHTGAALRALFCADCHRSVFRHGSSICHRLQGKGKGITLIPAASVQGLLRTDSVIRTRSDGHISGGVGIHKGNCGNRCRVLCIIISAVILGLYISFTNGRDGVKGSVPIIFHLDLHRNRHAVVANTVPCPAGLCFLCLRCIGINRISAVYIGIYGIVRHDFLHSICVGLSHLSGGKGHILELAHQSRRSVIRSSGRELLIRLSKLRCGKSIVSCNLKRKLICFHIAAVQGLADHKAAGGCIVQIRYRIGVGKGYHCIAGNGARHLTLIVGA